MTLCGILTWAAGAQRLTAGEAQPDKLPTPDAIRSAESIVKEALGPDLQRADAKGRQDLVNKMRAQSIDPKNEPAVQYVMLLDAAKLAASIGDTYGLIWISDALADHYPRASIEAREAILSDGARSARTAEAKLELGDALLGVADDAGWAGNFTAALRAAELGKAFVPNAYAAEKALVFREIVAALDAVKQKGGQNRPKDSVRRGVLLCFGTGDWESGLALLAAGDDPALAAVAAKEMAGVSTSADMTAMGQRYMDIARSRGRSPLTRSGAAARATWWYNKAVANAGGVTRIFLGKELAESRQLSVWMPRDAAVENLRSALLLFKWTWPGDNAQMTFRDDGTVSHRGMHATWKLDSPHVITLQTDYGDTVRFHFNETLTHWMGLGKTHADSGDRINN